MSQVQILLTHHCCLELAVLSPLFLSVSWQTPSVWMNCLIHGDGKNCLQELNFSTGASMKIVVEERWTAFLCLTYFTDFHARRYFGICIFLKKGSLGTLGYGSILTEKELPWRDFIEWIAHREVGNKNMRFSYPIVSSEYVSFLTWTHSLDLLVGLLCYA